MRVQPFSFIKEPIELGPSIDPDAQAFLTATGITDTTISGAINILVLSLKSDSLWDKLVFAYPFVGGTATTHKYNLKDPQDTNTAFRLTFVTETGTSITHSADGFYVENNGNFAAYANTYCAPASNVTLGSEHLSLYLNANYTQTDDDPVPTGAFNSLSQTSLIVPAPQLGAAEFSARMNGPLIAGNASTSDVGFWVGTRNSNISSLYRNGGSDESNTSTSGTLSTRNIWIGALNINDTSYGGGIYRFAWASYGDGLTSTDTVNLYNAVQTFQETLGREF